MFARAVHTGSPRIGLVLVRGGLSMDTAERAGATSATILRKKAADHCLPPRAWQHAAGKLLPLAYLKPSRLARAEFPFDQDLSLRHPGPWRVTACLRDSVCQADWRSGAATCPLPHTHARTHRHTHTHAHTPPPWGSSGSAPACPAARAGSQACRGGGPWAAFALPLRLGAAHLETGRALRLPVPGSRGREGQTGFHPRCFVRRAGYVGCFGPPEGRFQSRP